MKLMCIGCGGEPDDLLEYVKGAENEGTTPYEYVLHNEGTLNRENGHFLCDSCYIAAGQPVDPNGWVAP